jgi:pseudoazurin
MTRTILAAGVAAFLAVGAAQAAQVDVRMLNKGLDGAAMVFEPALVHVQPGDSIHFVAVDKGHNVESVPGMAPDGAPLLKSKINEEPTVTFDRPGVYGYRCPPHYPLGMVALVIVGEPVNAEQARKVNHPGLAKKNFARLFADGETKKEPATRGGRRRPQVTVALPSAASRTARRPNVRSRRRPASSGITATAVDSASATVARAAMTVTDRYDVAGRPVPGSNR